MQSSVYSHACYSLLNTHLLDTDGLLFDLPLSVSYIYSYLAQSYSMKSYTILSNPVLYYCIRCFSILYYTEQSNATLCNPALSNLIPPSLGNSHDVRVP